MHPAGCTHDLALAQFGVTFVLEFGLGELGTGIEGGADSNGLAREAGTLALQRGDNESQSFVG